MDLKIATFKSLAVVVLTGLSSVAQAQIPAKPNIIFIYTDDQRYDALSVVQQEQGGRQDSPGFQLLIWIAWLVKVFVFGMLL